MVFQYLHQHSHGPGIQEGRNSQCQRPQAGDQDFVSTFTVLQNLMSLALTLRLWSQDSGKKHLHSYQGSQGGWCVFLDLPFLKTVQQLILLLSWHKLSIQSWRNEQQQTSGAVFSHIWPSSYLYSISEVIAKALVLSYQNASCHCRYVQYLVSCYQHTSHFLPGHDPLQRSSFRNTSFSYLNL